MPVLALPGLEKSRHHRLGRVRYSGTGRDTEPALEPSTRSATGSSATPITASSEKMFLSTTETLRSAEEPSRT